MNVLGAVAAVRALGVDDATIVAALPEAGRVPGRFEPVDEGQDFAVLVDYAHTPDSLENVLRRGAAAGGGPPDLRLRLRRRPRPRQAPADGGDLRAPGRPHDRHVGQPALGGPGGDRRRDPRRDRGSGAGGHVEAIVDRHAAIERAVALAGAGDVVVIAGKGHEQGQEFEGGRKLPFDDVGVAREALRARLVA